MSTTRVVKLRILDKGPDSVFLFRDFLDLPVQAVAKSLSRLAKSGLIKRVRKGMYYYPKPTLLGPSYPKQSEIIDKALKKTDETHVFSAGGTGFQNLGLTTQVPHSYTIVSNQPAKQMAFGKMHVKIYRRSGRYLKDATQKDVWILDSLRNIKHIPDTMPDVAIGKIVHTLESSKPSLKRLIKISHEEPPRVRALLGAIAEHLGYCSPDVDALKKTLNPTTKYHLGLGACLPTGRHWNVE